MGKPARSKREEPTPKTGEDYEFKLPQFDERAFIRRELLSARASFYTIAVGIGAGVVSTLLYALPLPWSVGWLPIFGSLVGLRPLLTRLGFGEEVTAWKHVFGSLIMLFFTGLSVWIVGINVLALLGR